MCKIDALKAFGYSSFLFESTKYLTATKLGNLISSY